MREDEAFMLSEEQYRLEMDKKAVACIKNPSSGYYVHTGHEFYDLWLGYDFDNHHNDNEELSVSHEFFLWWAIDREMPCNDN